MKDLIVSYVVKNLLVNGSLDEMGRTNWRIMDTLSVWEQPNYLGMVEHIMLW